MHIPHTYARRAYSLCHKNSTIDLRGLAGSLPTQLGRLTSTRNLNLSNSVMSGLTPTEIGLMTELTHLDLTNSFVDDSSLPSEFGSLVKLGVAFFRSVVGKVSYQATVNILHTQTHQFLLE